MAFIKLLLSSNLIYIATMATIISIDKTSERVRRSALIDKFSNYMTPLHYNMELSLVNDYFTCNCTITIYIIHATHSIGFHMLNPVNNIKMWKLMQNNSEMICKHVSTDYYVENNTVVFSCENVLLPGTYYLYIWIKIPINIAKDSFGTSYINGDKVWLITTGIQSKEQPIYPFWNKSDSLLGGSIFNISIKHYRKYRALSNMPIQESRPAEDDMMWTYFNRTPIIPIDNAAFVVFDFHRINLNETVSIWCRPQLIPHVKFAINVIKYVTIYLNNYWYNSTNVVEGFFNLFENKVDHVVIPNLQDKVKNIFGFVFYREKYIIYNEKLDTAARKIIIASLVARKMIPKYIGNLLRPSKGFQLWFNEGFAIFFQTYIIDKALPKSRMMDLFVVQIQHELSDLNPYVYACEVEYDSYLENYLYPSFYYFKGSIIWRMLEHILSHDKFSKALHIYLNNQPHNYNKFMEKSADDFWNAMQSVIDESEYQFNVKSTVYSWAMQKCFPVLEVIRNYSNNTVTISAQFYNKFDEKHYYIPITYTTESESNFTRTKSNMSLTPSNSKIKFFLEKDQWIILNLQQAGYYRINYDSENWRKIARYLNSEEYTYRNIHILNRAQIIDDAFHFAIEKKLEFSIFWELVNYLRKEKDYVAWYPMIKGFETMSNIFVLLKFYPEFQGKLKLGFVEAWKLEIEDWYNENNADDYFECLKQELTKWKCVIYDISCKMRAFQLLQWHLKNPEQKILYGPKRWTYCNGLRQADSLWHTVFNNFMKEMDRTILECLAYSENSEIIINYLEEKLPEIYVHYIFKLPVDQVNATEALMANIFLSTIAKNAKFMLKNILNNFQKIKYKLVSKIATLIVIINNVYSMEQLYEINAFIKDEIRESRYPYESLDDMERKLKTRWSEIDRQRKYFQFLFNSDEKLDL